MLPAFFLPITTEIIDSFCFLSNAFYLYLYRSKRNKQKIQTKATWK